VIETLIRASPPRTEASFYGTAAGAGIDLVLDMPGGRRWAIEIRRSSAARLEKGCHIAIDDLKPSGSFIIYDGKERYTKSEGVEAISLAELSEELIRQGRL